MGPLRLVVSAILTVGLATGGPGHIRPAGAQSGAPLHHGCFSFHLVHPEVQAHGALQNGMPAGFRLYLIRGSDRREEGLVLSETPIITGTDLADAEASVESSTLQPAILLRLDAAGGRKLAEFSRANVGRAIGIVIDGRVVSAPLIREPILGGRGQITGTLTKGEAEEIAARLRSKDCHSN